MECFIHGGGFSNKGAEAMLSTVQTELSRRIAELNFSLSVPTSQVNTAYAQGLFPISNSGGRIGKLWQLVLGACINPQIRRAALMHPVSALEIRRAGNLDFVVDISGFNYSDDWGAAAVQRGLSWAKFCRETGRRCFCLPQAWGPFQNRDVKALVDQLIDCATLIYARDRESLKHLNESFPRHRDKIRLAPDIALKFTGASPEHGRFLLQEFGISLADRQLIGITPNKRIYERMPGKGSSNQYIKLLTEIAGFCLRDLQATVLLIPHEVTYGNIPKSDDRLLCGLVKSALGGERRCLVVDQILSAKSTKALLGQLDLLIGSRFHSLVFAITSGVPVVALGWSHKYFELLHQVGLERFVLRHDQDEKAGFREMIQHAWSDRENNRALLLNRLPSLTEKVDRVFDDVVASMLGSKSPSA